MIIAITGTPGAGKTSVSNILREEELEVVNLFKIAFENDFLIGDDKKRGSKIVDIGRLDDYVKEYFGEKKLVFAEGHLSHWLKCADRVIVLRVHPDELKKRLAFKGWSEEKVKENIDAEILDVILIETIDVHPKSNIFEIDTTGKSVVNVASNIFEIKNNDFKPMKKYNIGNIDWSEEILKDFLKK